MLGAVGDRGDWAGREPRRVARRRRARLGAPGWRCWRAAGLRARVVAAVASATACVGLLVFGAGGASALAAPTVAVTSPAAGSTVEGKVSVSATATADVGDYPTSISLYDGAIGIGGVSCQGQQTCSGSVEWDATGLSGQHSLTASVSTAMGLQATSAADVVTVDSPSPTATVTSPAAGATVEGTVVVQVSAATDPSQTDYPTQITVFDGALAIGTVTCQGQQTCQGSVQWQATGLSGAHNLTAQVSTERGLSATSAASAVTVVSPPPMVTITSPPAGTRLGKTIVVAVRAATDPSQTDYPTSIAVVAGTEQLGTISCEGQMTCLGSLRWNSAGVKGPLTLTATVATETGRSATSAPVLLKAAPKLPRRPAATVDCHLAATRYQAQRLGLREMHRQTRTGRRSDRDRLPRHLRRVARRSLGNVVNCRHLQLQARSSRSRNLRAVRGRRGRQSIRNDARAVRHTHGRLT